MDIEWANELKELNTLVLHNYTDRYELTEEFFNKINNLIVKNIYLEGTFIVNLGNLEEDKNYEFDYKDIPIIKAITDKNSKVYRENVNLYIPSDSSNINDVILDNENKKLYVTPKNGADKQKYLFTNSATTIILKWKNPADVEEVKLDEKIKKAVISQNADTNGDGILTREELRSYNLRYFSIDANSEELDLTGIENIENMEHLSIYNIKDDMDFSALRNLNKLQYLSISGNISDLSSLKTLTQIKTLDLYWKSGNNVNLDDLEELQNLEKISIHASGIKDFSPLSKLKNLKALDIQSNDTIDCEQLKEISSLEKFSTLNSELKNFEKLKALENLKELSLSNVFFYNIKEIENFTNLETLYIHGNIYDEILDFNNLKNLKTLSLSFNVYNNTETEPLSFDRMESLETLSISSYSDTIVDFKNIDKLNNLKTISINGYIANNAKNIGEISEIPNLETLSIYSGDYQTVNIDVDNIANPNLKELTLTGTIKDISALTKLTKLEKVTINNKGLSEVDIEKYLNDAENIKVKNKLKLGGTWEEKLEPILCGQTKNVDLLQNAIIKRMTSKESALYNNDKINITRTIL